MTYLEPFQREEEIRKNRLWKNMTPYQKHMALMYFYRIVTDFENLFDYVETHRFLNSGICPTDFPDFIFYMKPNQLREHAYEVISERIPA